MSKFILSENVEVLIGNQWCPGQIAEIMSEGRYCVALDSPPMLSDVGETHGKLQTTDKYYSAVVIVYESPINFAGLENIRKT